MTFHQPGRMHEIIKVLCCAIYMSMAIAQKPDGDAKRTCGTGNICPPVEDDKLPAPITYNNQTVTLCSRFRCNVVQLESVKAVYGVYFCTQKDYVKKTGLSYNSIVESVPYWCEMSSLGVPVLEKARFPTCALKSNEDRCCPTYRYATYYTQLQNINGQMCYILHMPVWYMYQYTTVGICGNGGKCRQCVLQYTLQTMVALRAGNSNLTIEQFNIPTYCICMG